jgi:hypothetical protein
MISGQSGFSQPISQRWPKLQNSVVILEQSQLDAITRFAGEVPAGRLPLV